MLGVKFNNYDLFKEYGLILISKEISAPSIKTQYVELEGVDGSLDLTDCYGEINYSDREISLEFASINKNLNAVFTNFQNDFHGKKVKIIFDDDADYFYLGRISCDKWKCNKRVADLGVSIICNPYKYKLHRTVINHAVASEKTIILSNSRQSVIPLITTSGSINITKDNKTYSIQTITGERTEIVLNEGKNLLTLNGNCNITFDYQEGSF